MIGRFLCWIGWHRRYVHTKFLPSISADIVTEYRVRVDCRRCGIRIEEEVRRWDGKNFVPVEEQS